MSMRESTNNFGPAERAAASMRWSKEEFLNKMLNAGVVEVCLLYEDRQVFYRHGGGHV